MSNAVKLLKETKSLLPLNNPFPNRRILVVDDEPEIAAGIQRILSPNMEKVVSIRSSRRATREADGAATDDFEIVVVNNPKDALQAVKDSIEKEKPFALGFFDVMLGADIDGIELVKQIMALDEKIFAVFVTAYHDRSVDNIGTNLGDENRERWDYINKPFNEGEILQKARNATSLWDLNQLKLWQSDRLNEAHQLLLDSERQNAVAAIGRSVAHEFGNLLTHIIGHAEIALQSSELRNAKSSIEIILKAGKTASSVLRNFRDLNEANNEKNEFEVCKIKAIVQEALELMEFRFRRHSIQICDRDVGSIKAEVNKNSLIQVIANLFINAIHVMPRGGEIELATKVTDKSFQLNIRDTGPGIPEEILPRVTEALYTTKGKEGSGLGLAICKEIIEVEHCGLFTIANDPRGGVLISITIPLVKER